MAHRILVVDDDPNIRDVICFALKKADMEPVAARDGAEALSLFTARRPQLLVLDIGMPEVDGLEVCRQIRRTSDVPILFLTARDDEIDRILGLEMGGDDYVTKPFSPRELVARINAILKRTTARAPDVPDTRTILEHGDLKLDAARHVVTYRDAPLPVTAIEFTILQSVLSRPGMTFTRETIMSAAYGHNVHVSGRTIDSHIRNIRAKCRDAGCSNAIETVHGVGFRLGPCGGAPEDTS